MNRYNVPCFFNARVLSRVDNTTHGGGDGVEMEFAVVGADDNNNALAALPTAASVKAGGGWVEVP